MIPAVRLWRNAWQEFIPFLDYDTEIREGDLFDQRHRVAQRPLPPRDQGPQSFPHRAGSPEMPILGHPVTGPDRDRPEAMDHALETSVECLPRSPSPTESRPANQLTEDAIPVNLTDPAPSKRELWDLTSSHSGGP